MGKSFSISISRQGHRLAYTVPLNDLNIWRVEIPSSPGQSAAPTRLIYSTQSENLPQISPDGRKIAFSSDRTGTLQIWVCDSDGSNPLQLTFLSGPMAGTPRWSPDSRQITFDARAEGHSDIYVINAEGGSLRRLTTEDSDDVVPSWSRDGRWVYFASNRGGTRQVWKVPAGGGQAVQVTRKGGIGAFESPDGQYLYYSKSDAPGVWRAPVEGGEESLVLERLTAGDWSNWAVVSQGIYFINSEAQPRPTIEFFDFATRRVKKVVELEKGLVIFLAVSPDVKWMVYCQMDQRGSDILLIENFR